jgi:predicted nuclease of predicted toxin-antitoxin system
VRLLFDQNLSRTLVRRLAIEFPDSVHVTDVGLDTASDRQIWNYAGEQGFVIVSKDSDFRQLAFLIGPPPKAVWLRMGNSSTLDILTVLRDYREAIDEFSRSEDEALLVTARHRHDRIATGQGVPNITGFGCASVAGRTRLPASGDRGLLASATVRSIGSVPRWVVSHNRRYGAPRPSPPWGSSPCSARRDTARFAHGIGNWVALAGVITALVSTVTASWLSYREAAASRLERDKDRTSDRRGRGRQQALATLVPLFAFVADLGQRSEFFLEPH